MIPTVGPQLVYPPDGMTFFGGPFTFSWNRFAGALLYHLQSSDDSLFQTNLFLNDSTLADTSRWSIPTDSMFSSPYGGGYYWRVRARTTTGWSAWSAPWMYVLSPCEVPESQTVPLEFSLHQSYPNPFNPSTTIRYALPHRTHVMLTVFNTLGQHVATLVNGEVEAGYHEVRFDASGLASGVYFYRLQTGDFVATKRLIVLR
jgi:hypothetical protein